MTSLFKAMLDDRIGQYIFAGLLDNTVCSGYLIAVDTDAFALKRYDVNDGEYRDLLVVKMQVVKYFAFDGMDLARERFEIECLMDDAERQSIQDVVSGTKKKKKKGGIRVS